MPPQYPGNAPLPLSRDFLGTVAESPGVYLMKDATGVVLYVGKARDLRKRLASYARHGGGPLSKTGAMLARVAAVETILTRTEKEALILEAAFIKKHRPRYNVVLRDDKSYPLIKITVNERWPRLIVTRLRQNDGARYFGPYTSSTAMWGTVRLLRQFFPLRRCGGREVKETARPCLNYQMRRCSAPCAGRIDHGGYLRMVGKILMLLEGRTAQLVDEIAAEMRAAAVRLDFERAAALRDSLRALQQTVETQIVSGGSRKDSDIFGFVREAQYTAVNVLQIRGGVIAGQYFFLLEETIGEGGMVLSEVLKRYYTGQAEALPGEILLPFPVDDAEVLAEWFGDLKREKVRILSPKQGRGKALLEMAMANAVQHLEGRRADLSRWRGLAARLAETLGLRLVPSRVECLDISNIGGEQAVGALVCFVDGSKEKKGYRYFRLRIPGPDDFAMIAECVRRHLIRGREEGTLPDLLVVDGGSGQVNAARKELDALGLDEAVDLLGIAKGKAGAADVIFVAGSSRPVRFAAHAPELLFLMKIRDEAHRFGISLHRRLRQRQSFASPLDAVPGIGKIRKQKLLAFFGSLQRMQGATVDEIAAISGIGRGRAERIWKALH